MYSSLNNIGSNGPKQAYDLPNNVDQYKMLEINNQQELVNIIRSNRIVCVEVFADWCGPCRQIASQYSVMASEMNKKGFCVLLKQRYESLPLEEKGSVQGIPLFKIFLDGKLVEQVIGGNLSEVETKLKQLFQVASQQAPPQPPQPPSQPQSRPISAKLALKPVRVQQQYQPQPPQPPQSQQYLQPPQPLEPDQYRPQQPNIRVPDHQTMQYLPSNVLEPSNYIVENNSIESKVPIRSQIRHNKTQYMQ